MSDYLIDENTLKAVTSYLKTRPYAEVSQAIPILEGLKKAEPAPLAVVPEVASDK
jgi:hypothetical protein